MTAPPGGADGGRIDVEVRGDTTGFAADLKKQIEARTKNIRARVQATVDARRLATELRTATRAAEQQAQIKLKVGIDSAHLAREMRKAITEATRAAGGFKVKVGVDLQGARLQAQINALARATKAQIKVGVDADTSRAAAVIAAFRAREERRPIVIPVRTGTPTPVPRGGGGGGGPAPNPAPYNSTTQAASRLLGVLGRIGMSAGMIQLATTAVTALGGSLIAVVGAASQAVGALAAIPNAVGMIGQGIGVLIGGFSGVGEAVKAMGKSQAAVTSGAQQSARAREAAAERISDAQKRVQQAQQSADRTAIDGARAVAAARQRLADVQERSAASIVSAERNLANAQRESKRAQDDLTRAREEARERLDDLGLSLRGAALDEEGAILAVERARERLNEVNTDPGSTDMDRREADLAYRQTQQRVAEIRESNEDLQNEAADAFAKGVDGADNVVAAQERVVDANQGVRDAEMELSQARAQAARDVQDAQQDLSQTIADTAQANADAQQGVIDAQEDLSRAMKDAADQASQTSAAVDQLAVAMNNLSPAGQRFAQFVAGTLQPRIKELKFAIQEALLPPLQTAITTALPLLDTLQTGLVGTATVIGEVANKGATVMASPLFRGDVATIMAANNTSMGLFGQAAVNLLQPLASIAVAAGPLLERFARFTVHVSELIAKEVEAGRETGRLEAFMTRAGDRMAQIGDIVANLAVTFFNLGKAGTDSGDSLLGKLEALTLKWREWTGSVEGQERLKGFFDSMQPITEKLMETVGLLAQAFVGLGENGGGAIGAFLDTLNFFLRILNSLLDSPIGPFISALLAIGGVVGAFSLAGSAILGLVRPIGLLIGILGKLPLIFRTVAFAFRILAMSFAVSPFGLILVAVAALVAAFIWAWNNIDGFKEGVMAALGAVKDFILMVWDAIKTATLFVWDAIKAYFELWWNVISTVFEAAMTAIKAVIEFIWEAIKLYFTTWWTVISTIFTTAIDAIKWVLETAWNVIKTVVETVWNAIKTVIETVWGAIRAVFETVIGVIKGIWEGFWNVIKTVAETVFGAARTVIENVLGFIRGAFETAVSVISAIWDGLRAAIRAPIEFVVNTVYNNGIRPVWNWVSGLFDGPQLQEFHFAKGGMVPGYAPGRDRVPAILSPGEGVLVPEAARALGGAKGIQAINAAYSSRVPSPTVGRRKNTGQGLMGTAAQEKHGQPVGLAWGWLESAGNFIGDRWNDVTGFVGDVVGNLASMIGDGWATAVEFALKPFRSMAAAVLPDNPIGTTIEGGVGKMLDGILGAVTNREKEYTAKMAEAAGVGGDVGRWSGLVAETLRELGQPADMLPWVLKLIERESGGNPNAINNWDINAQNGVPSQGLMQTIPPTFNAYAGPYRSRGIRDPKANIYAGLNYGVKRYGSVANIPGIRSMRSGGAYQPYDRGGPWPSGTAGVNTSGQTESVLTGTGVTRLGHAVVAMLNGERGSLVDLVGRASPGQLAAGGSNIGVLIESGAIQLIWHGDKPTSTQETLNVGLRTLANLGLFDAGPGGR